MRQLTPGDYFLTVEPSYIGSLGTYLIRLTGTQSEAVLLQPDDDPYEAEIAAQGEEDLYAFSATTAGEYTIETFLRTHPDTVISLFGPNTINVFLAENDNKSGRDRASRITMNLQIGAYFVKVRSNNREQTGAYSISVSGP